MIFHRVDRRPHVARRRFPVSGFPPVVSSGGYFPDRIVAGRFVGEWARFNPAADGWFPVFPPYLSASFLPDFFHCFYPNIHRNTPETGIFRKSRHTPYPCGFRAVSGLFMPFVDLSLCGAFSCPAVCRLSPEAERNGDGMRFFAGGETFFSRAGHGRRECPVPV